MRQSAAPRTKGPASVRLPTYVPSIAVLGPKGTIIHKLQDLSGAHIFYDKEEHKVDIRGAPEKVQLAAQLVDRNVRHFLLTRPKGYPYNNRELVNILSDNLADVGRYDLHAYNRPLLHNLDGGLVFTPASSSSQSTAGAATGSEQSREHRQVVEELVDEALELACQSPVDYDELNVKFNLGKGVLIGQTPGSPRSLSAADLQRWIGSKNKATRMIFDANLSQDAVKALDSLLLGIGFQVSELSRSVTLQMATSIPWVHYHASFDVGQDGTTLELDNLSTESFKANTVTVVSSAEQIDYRARLLGKGNQLASDPVMQLFQELSEQGQFQLVSNTRVNLPDSLRTHDLRLSTARVKVKRTYSGQLPVPLPGQAQQQQQQQQQQPKPKPRGWPPANAAASNGNGNASSNSVAAVTQPVQVQVSVAAVIDNAGRKRLEVIATCPSLNKYLMDLHTGKQTGQPEQQAAMVESYLSQMCEFMTTIRNNVPSAILA